ncbi:nuclear pore complex subunit nup159 [Botrytis cinerea]
MAFSFGRSVQLGPELEDIQTTALHFHALAGESKLQLLPSAWPADNPPPPTSSLLSISSRRGLLAAAGPDAIVVARTASVEKAFEGTGSGNFKSFQPELRIPMPMRVSQLAFSADDAYLILSAETGGGLAVYDVDALLNGSTQTAFEIPTNGESLRALVPNPTREKGELLAVVTGDGNLMMANLKDRAFKPGPNGQVLRSGVSCVSWSTKGKQLVAGLGDGSAVQMTPEGEIKAEIPKPPGLNDGDHVSSITWLENNVFLLVHTPSNFDPSNAPESKFHLATRQPPAIFTFQKLTDPAPPYGLNRSPPHHFLLRLKDFPPSIQDLLVVGSTASTDINLFTKSSAPLTTDKPSDRVTGVFTMTEMADDSFRAQLPATSSGGFGDTSPIGFALDLSSTTKIWKPIPGDEEIDESPYPAPALMVLNNEGVLASWWIIYNDSIRQKTIYPGLVAAEGVAPSQQATTSAPAFASTSSQPFGSQAPTNSAFGKPAIPAGTGAFGSSSAMGKTQSPWGAQGGQAGQAFGTPSFGTPSMAPPAAQAGPAFGAPAFGTPSAPAFGQSGLPGRQSVWGSTNTAAPSTGTAFGQSSALGASQPVFGSSAATGSKPQPSGGFANFANQGGFAAAAAPATGGSIFGSKPAALPTTGGGVFGSTNNNAPSTSGGMFGSSNTSNTAQSSSLFGGAGKTEQQSSSSAFGGSKFVIGSTFKADTSKESEPDNTTATKKKTPAVQTPVSKDADMDASEAEEQTKPQSATPSSTPAPAKSSFFNTTAPATGGGLFGSASGSTKPNPFASTEVKATPNPFAAPAKPTQNPFAAALPPAPSSPPVTIKQEPSDRMPEAPLPPDPTSKSSYTVGETSASENDAPLPPDFTPKPKSVAKDVPASEKENDAPLPPDFVLKPKPTQTEIPPPIKKDTQSPAEAPAPESPTDDIPGGPDDEGDDSDFLTEDEDDDQSKEPSEEGSGEDLGKLDSPTPENNVTPSPTPQNSFGGNQKAKADTSPFTKVQKPPSFGQSRGLFGEISAAPKLPPPTGPIIPPSPRSPSPVRTAVPPRMMRPDTSRSASAPGFASQLLNAQKPSGRAITPTQSTFATSVEQEKAQEQRRLEARARKEAEETRTLVDDEDDKMQRFLTEDIEATRTLDEFVAYSDVKSPEKGDSIPAQVEILYRDINSMIDTLGLNAKALKSFIKGHTEQLKEDRGRQDLEDDETWSLDEIEALSYIVEKDLARELEMGRIQDVDDKIETCKNIEKETVKLRQRFEEVKKTVQSHTHPDQVAIARAQPLNAEQAAQQHDLRRDYLKFQKLLSEAEEGLTVLRAKIASQDSIGNAKTTAPTVEAIMRTITKMTSMAEKRSGDVDVLENQMRKMRFNTTINTPGTSNSSRLFYTPESQFKGSASRRLGGSTFMMSGSGSIYGSPSPRKKVSGYSTEEKSEISEAAKRKREARDKLRRAVQGAGVKVKPFEDE